MSRKYNAKQTRENIIETAIQLFMEKGFEKTSMQDIANTLGISKGGIYHHFKSKEDIIDIVRENKANSVEAQLNKWRETIKAQSAKEELIAILEKNITDQQAHSMDEVFRTQMKSPDFIVSMMKNSIDSSAPAFAQIIKEGIEDGSITTNYPEECAEVFFLLINIWCDPVIFQADPEKSYKRLQFVQEMMKSMGIDIVSDKVIEETADLLKKLYPEAYDQKE
ncbi:TetR/AcrR family transcriptional regulator [Oceanobacillus jeddahense]|uniref:TetR/AcrR family transcriptional regulator n=1 Tax=Oceanobacillus jeddahense TaxID=1462527 RepID=A0ABY5JNL1_9BACI|nr:TetR/AcrR family transcriptional regulator [Oceanobacillus jeddahense]UUI01414.1 TetR/AcrR family transcriptional regulator [Oceanobacillus jeddahense]